MDNRIKGSLVAWWHLGQAIKHFNELLCITDKKNLSFFCYDIAHSKLLQIIKVDSKYFLANVLIQLVKFLDPPHFPLSLPYVLSLCQGLMQPRVAQSLLCKHRRPWPWGSPS